MKRNRIGSKNNDDKIKVNIGGKKKKNGKVYLFFI
jgi:hypothetical protein